MDPTPPPPGTVERWCWDLVRTTDPEHKLEPPPPPDAWEGAPPPRRLRAPGRPPSWEVTTRSPRSPRKGALRDPRRRAALLHTFLHHELQAAELMAWALLAFPETPRALRRGLLGVLLDELRHLQGYRGRLRALGRDFGELPIRDWFWSRVPRAESPAQFLATMGLGLEGGNLDHADRYAGWFADAGDAASAELLETVREEEVAHVRFAAHWFRELTGGLDFAAWEAALPEPLSPTVFRGRPLNRRDRLRAGMSEEFLSRLEEH